MRLKGMLSILSMTLLFLAGCSFLYGKPAPPESSSIVDVTAAEEVWEVPSFSGVTHEEKQWSTDDMKGKWWLTKTIFTRCPTVCTVMTPNMVQLQEAIEKEGLDVQIVSFTVDPEFDTPERLKDYGEAYEANLETWDFITGYTEEELKDFVFEAMKQNIIKIPDQNDIGHPTRFYLVNPDGEIVRMYEGEANFDLDAYIADLKQLVSKK